MNDDVAVDVPSRREALALARASVERCGQEAHRHEQEGQRWQRRIALAEQHGDDELAAEAARQARHHAALAQTLAAQLVDQELHMRQLQDELGGRA